MASCSTGPTESSCRRSAASCEQTEIERENKRALEASSPCCEAWHRAEGGSEAAHEPVDVRMQQRGRLAAAARMLPGAATAAKGREREKECRTSLL
jgi:ribosomal protein S7